LLLSLFLSACGSAIGASSWPGITVDEESKSVYVAYNQHVYSLDAETGRESWRFPAEADNGTSFFASPVISGEDQLLIGGYDKILYSLNPQNNGRINWQFDTAGDRYIGSPLVTDEGVFAPNADGMLYGLSNAGQDNWSFDSGDALWASPTSDGDLIFLPSIDHNLYALSAQNGNVSWQQDLGGGIVGSAKLF
jgi:outer membrane protein assembly factor BamB